MRKIEQAIAEAIRNGSHLQKENSTVAHGGGTTTVHLHGHTIALIRKLEAGKGYAISVCLRGWNTRTTRGRLDLVIRTVAEMRANDLGPMTSEQITAHANGTAEFRYPKGLGVSCRKGVVRIHDARGETEIDDKEWHRVEL